MTVSSEEAVRLVIWDLDDTLWDGTLSEGGIEKHRPENYAIVAELARRGIMSSICSKNDFDAVKQVLLEQGVWDYFLFPSIDWSSKGERIRAIVEAMQLRPQSVIFIDDHPSNRAEALAQVPGLRAVDETFIQAMLQSPLLIGKDDSGLTRLTQYKNLEQKAAHRQHASSDVVFLSNSNIRVDIEHDCTPHLDRIVELINRTNQLNFTKKRLPEESEAAKAELLAQLNATSGRRAGVVRVRDKFGDYGIVGFWMMDGIWVEPYMIHFVFSCRTLGMGVEQWVYQKLGCPRLEVVGEVVSELSGLPAWINANSIKSAESTPTSRWGEVRLRGGCELEVVKHFISFQASHVVSEFVFPRDGQVIWASHSVTLFAQGAAATAEGRRVIRDLGLSPEDLSSTFLHDLPAGTCLILSNSGDGQVTLFKHKELDLIVPLKLFGVDLSARDEVQIESYVKNNKLTVPQEANFRRMLDELWSSFVPLRFEDFDFHGLYARIFDAIPSTCLLVILQPVTVAPRPDGQIVTLGEQERVNRWMAEAADGRPNVRIVRTADCISSTDDLRNHSHLHFKRDVYFRIFRAIEETYSRWKRDWSAR